MDCSPPGSYVHGIFQARVLEWGAIAFSTHSMRPALIWFQRQTLKENYRPISLPNKPMYSKFLNTIQPVLSICGFHIWIKLTVDQRFQGKNGKIKYKTSISLIGNYLHSICIIFTTTYITLVAQMVKNLPAMPETWVQSLGWEDPSPVSLPGEFHGQRSLTGYSPWGDKELDTTEQLSHKHTTCKCYVNRCKYKYYVNSCWHIQQIQVLVFRTFQELFEYFVSTSWLHTRMGDTQIPHLPVLKIHPWVNVPGEGLIMIPVF